METERRISTGIDGLDEAIDYLRPGDTVVWQCEHISDYMYVATRFVTNVARKGDRIVYIRFADHEEIMDTAALRERGANVEKYELDPRVGFETFAVQVHRIIDKEPLGTFFVFDCLSDLQKYWFSDLMISNFFLLINPFLIRRQAVAYQPIDYEKHTYETMSRIRREPPLQPQRAVLRHQNAEAHVLLSVVRVQADDALRLHAALRRNMPVKPPPFRRSAPHGRAAVKNRIFHIKQPPA